ncbi:response regulator [Asticcacaulis sp. EMRT-3]|uniref:response regulator n=1 Tax=Asticcacaulis sp. EMRT-3 TaxID=3040349 RepID=UPI0024AEBB66|nr:response regulator [Asticcacaulis sp. EMRT-3]MDI7775981.1 response regulator [Asticcacaulis sp. EMRT-3]
MSTPLNTGAQEHLSPEARLKAREDFFRLMSHEIRTPLNGVMGMLSLLSRTPLTPDQNSYLATARESGEHLLTLVNDLLDYARIDAGRIQLETSEVRLEPLLQSVAELLAPRAHANGIEVVWALDPRLDYIHADEGRLRQILFNLAGNAIKFTTSGGVLIRVGLTEDGLIRFSVRDTGPGIPEEARVRIFEEYGQVKISDATLYGGAGLGLVVVKKLAEVMQGELTLDSEVGRGSCFAIEFCAPYGLRKTAAQHRLPHAVTLVTHNTILADGAASHLTAADCRVRMLTDIEDCIDPQAMLLCDRAAVAGPVAAPSANSLILLAAEQRDELDAWRDKGWAGYLIKPLRRTSLLERLEALHNEARDAGSSQQDDERIVSEAAPDKAVLLVEDNPVNALLAQILLQREGCRVERASSGEEAIDILKARSFDIIFMDLGLPGVDGLGATRAVRALGIRTPIIALTANAYEEDRRASLHAGMNDFLTKPIELVALKHRLQTWAGDHAAARSA